MPFVLVGVSGALYLTRLQCTRDELQHRLRWLNSTTWNMDGAASVSRCMCGTRPTLAELTPVLVVARYAGCHASVQTRWGC